MSHDSSSSAQRASPTGTRRLSGHVSSAAANDGPARPSESRRAVQKRRAKSRRLFNKQRENFLSDLVRNMDIVIYAELSAVYYMDCSFFRFLLRCLLEFTFMTPKPANVPEPPYQNHSRPIYLIIFGNLACACIHAFSNAPSAGEATRGYLHGGLAMDFIGQKGPISRVHLVLLDFLIMIMQISCLGAVVARNKAKKAAEEQPSGTTTAADQDSTAQTEQTLDHEERGQLASEQRSEDIELRDLNRPAQTAAEGADGDEETERTNLLADERAGEDERLRALDEGGNSSSVDTRILEVFSTGQAVIAHLSIARIVREQMALASGMGSAGSSIQSGLGRSGSIGAAFDPGNSRLGLRLRVGERIFRI